MRRCLYFLLLAVLCPAPAPAQEAAAAPPAAGSANVKEDPVSIFQSKIGDEDVEFLMRGSWRATLSAATGLRFGPDSPVLFPFGFPGFGNGIFFEQVPSLTFSVWLAKRWFLEVSVVAKQEENTILLGYRGLPGEFVREVMVGNKGAKIDAYDFIDLPRQSASSLGASALFATPVSTHELLVRYDSTKEGRKVFVGKGEVAVRELSPADLMRGRYFMLPDPGVENLAVYLEDKDGPYADDSVPPRHYRLAQASEIFQDAANGFLYILIEHRGRIAVHYAVGGFTVGDAALGAGALPRVSGNYIDLTVPGGLKFDWGVTWLGDDMANRRQLINGQTCLLLWEQGTFSPFEMLSAYDLGQAAPDDISRVRIRLAPRGAPESSYTLPGPVSISFNVVPGRRFFTAYRNLDARSDFANHYPFPDADRQLYGPTLDHQPPYFEYLILAEAATGVETYALESNVVPGSVRVKRNGREETRFTYNETNYTLTFNTAVLPYDRIEVTYRVSKTEKNAGDLVLGWGNKFLFSPLASLDLALGLRWNILPGAYTEKAYSKTGALVFSAGLHGETGPFAYRLSGAVSYANPDTTGIMRLAGMEGKGLELEPGEDLASPASPPTGAGALGARGRILYRNYREYDALGGAALLPYDATLPASHVWSYSSGSKPGPYLVAGEPGTSHGESLVLDFELGAGEWVGCQVPIAYKNGTLDLSGIHSVIAMLRAVEVTGSFDVYLQLGAVGEDIDDDDVLDEETSTLAGGYTFNDADNGVALAVGGGPKNEGNGVINSEDLDGNGSLDDEDASLVWTAAPVSFAADMPWGSYSLPVLDQNRLRKVRALRIIVVNTSGGPNTGRLLMDKITLAGTAVYAESTGGTFEVREVKESFLTAPPAVSLPDAFPEVKDTFHSGNETQEVLEATWSGGGGSDKTIKTVLGNGSEGIRYRRLVFYLERSALFGGDASVSLVDRYQRGVTAALPDSALGTGVWQKIEIDLFSSRLSVNGTAVAADVDVDADYDSLLFFSLDIPTASDAGRLLLDEIHLSEAESRLGAAASFTASLHLPGASVAVGGVPVLSDVSVVQNVNARTSGFATLYSRPQDEGSFRSLTAARAGVFFAGLEAEILADGLGDAFSFSGGHTLTLPRFDFPVRFTDRYTQATGAGGEEFFRENTLRGAIPAAASLNLQQQAFSRSGVLSQVWTSDLGVTVLAPYTVSLAARLSQSASGFSRPAVWYGEGWLSGYRYLVPWTETDATERSFKWHIDQTLGTVPVGARFVFGSGLSSYDITPDSRRQKDTLDLKLSLPVKIGTLVIEPYYSRSLSALAAVGDGGGLGTDVRFHFERYGAYDYFFTLIPLYEILSPDVNDTFRRGSEGLEQANYKPEIGCTLGRPFGSSLLDLAVPSRITLSYGKEYVRQASIFNAYERVAADLLWNAVNLFGERGAHRLTGVYAVDSFATSFKTGFLFRETRKLESFTGGVESAWSFEGATGNKLTLRNNFSVAAAVDLTLSDKGALEYVWNVVPPDGIALPLIEEKIAKTGKFVHKESLEFSFQNLQKEASTHPVNLILKHETSILYPQFGSLRGEIAFGLDDESYPAADGREHIVIAGLRLTLELVVDF